MPWVRAMAKVSAQWKNAKAHVPQATDMNHLNIIAGTNTGTNGILGVSVQPETWTNEGLANGEIHLAKTYAPDGEHVETLFDLIGDLDGDGEVRRAYLGNKTHPNTMGAMQNVQQRRISSSTDSVVRPMFPSPTS